MKTLDPLFPTTVALRHAARDAHLRYVADRQELAHMRELGAPELLCTRLRRDLRSAYMTLCAVYREQRRAILYYNYPEELPHKRAGQTRVTTVPLRRTYPQVYEKRKTLLRRAKDRLIEGRITLEQWRAFEVEVIAHQDASYAALQAGEPLPTTPAYPVTRA